MRWSRVIAALGVVVLPALVVCWGVLASPARAPAEAPSSPAALQGALQREVQLLGTTTRIGRPRVIVVPAVPRRAFVPGTPCYVGSGGCSLIPCVQFAGGAVGDVVLRTAVPVPLRPGLRPAPPGTGCRGGPGTPKVIRVSGP